VMREVQGRLTSTPIPIVALAREVYAVPEPTRAQIESVRRAVRRLVQLGRAARSRGTRYVPTGERNEFGDPVFERYCSWVRTAYSAEEISEARRMARALMEGLARLR